MLECLPVGRQGGIGRPVFRQAGALIQVYMFYVYAISSKDKNYIYVGLTSNLKERLKRHNGLRERTTKFYAPFKLLYSEQVKTRIEARVREKYWKSGVGKEKLRSLRDTM
ncbi:GIY-YIG nuclease family protein [uncultured Polaribacter sp.]|uniref:GIY-YIG nuclease family protein n=1 Tax=uncultured Polaribacter sp. TaxID=174711 RepID=UPI0026086850|nr:GIY-YIG nuclease family protein [uncultured Polaribacter sp.]